MRYITNATFIVNIAKTNIGIIENIEIQTIKEIIEEANNELGIRIDEHVNIKTISSKEKHEISKSEKRYLSAIDINLLNVAQANKKNCILITDDRRIRTIAKANRIRSYTTPQFISFMIRNKVLTPDEGVRFLSDLKKIYIRPRDIDKVEARIKKWKVSI